MPKSRNKKRHSRKTIRVFSPHFQPTKAFDQATQIRLMAGALKDQAQLDTLLLQEKDPEKRQQLFNFIKPFLKFPNPEMPASETILRPPGILKP